MKGLVHLRRAGRQAKGAALVEFALVAVVLFLPIIFVSFNFFFWTFAKAVLHNAVRDGARYAITGRTSGSSQDAAIRQVVRDNSFGLLTSAPDSAITLAYFAPDGSSTSSNAAGNIVVVSVLSFTPATISPWVGVQPVHISVSAVDKVEPYSGAPPTR